MAVADVKAEAVVGTTTLKRPAANGDSALGQCLELIKDSTPLLPDIVDTLVRDYVRSFVRCPARYRVGTHVSTSSPPVNLLTIYPLFERMESGRTTHMYDPEFKITILANANAKEDTQLLSRQNVRPGDALCVHSKPVDSFNILPVSEFDSKSFDYAFALQLAEESTHSVLLSRCFLKLADAASKNGTTVLAYLQSCGIENVDLVSLWNKAVTFSEIEGISLFVSCGVSIADGLALCTSNVFSATRSRIARAPYMLRSENSSLLEECKSLILRWVSLKPAPQSLELLNEQALGRAMCDLINEGKWPSPPTTNQSDHLFDRPQTAVAIKQNYFGKSFRFVVEMNERKVYVLPQSHPTDMDRFAEGAICQCWQRILFG